MFKETIRVYQRETDTFEEAETWVDSDSTYSWLPASLLRRLNIQPTAQREFILADGTAVRRDIAQVRLRISDREPFYTYCVFADEGAMLLLGAVALEEAGLAVDPVNRRLVPVPGYALTAP